MRVKIPVFVALGSLAALFAAAPAYAADPTGNIQLSMPSEIQFRVGSDGRLVSPSESLLKMENNSSFEVRIDAVQMVPADGVNVVDDAYSSKLPNSVSIKFGPSGDKMRMSGCAQASKNVENELAWTMGTKEVDENSASIQLVAEGYASNIEDVRTVGSVEWHVVSDTVTNDVYEKLGDLRSDVDDMLDKFYPVGSVYTSVNNVDPAEMFGGTWERIEDQFLLCSGSSYAAGTTGGSSTNTLTTANLPAHTHSYDKANSTSGSTSLTVANLPSHTHTYDKANGTSGSTTLTVDQIPSHMHNIRNQNGTGSNGLCATNATSGTDGNNWCFKDVMADKSNNDSGTFATTYTGGSKGHTHTVSTTSTNSGGTGSGTGHTHSVTSTSTNSGSTGSGTAVNNMPPYLSVYVWKRVA